MIERLITWNVGSRADRVLLSALLFIVEKFHPAVLALQETADRGKVLAEFCERSGYRLVRFTPGRHSESVTLLLRPDLPQGQSGVKKLSPRTWVGRRVAGSRATGWAAPKWLVWLHTSFLGINWVVGSTHLTPSHHVRLARVLVQVQVGVAAVWMRTRSRVVLLGGDFNETLGSKWNLLAPLKLLATPYTARSFDKRAIDMWWVTKKRLDKHGVEVKVEALDDIDASDHKPVMITLKRRSEHACPVCGFVHEGVLTS